MRRYSILQRVAGQGNERKFTLSFSSEKPVSRWFGNEILDHSPEAVDLSRLNQIGCVLFNHNRDCVIGKVTRAWVELNRAYAEIEIDDDDFSDTIFRKIQGGTLKGVSVGYSIDVIEEVKENAISSDGRFKGPCTIAKRWTPFEISVVSVPADETVGIGREAETEGGIPLSICLAQNQINNNNFLLGRFGNMNEQASAINARLQELTRTAMAESRNLNAQEQAEYTRLQAQLDALQAAPAGATPAPAAPAPAAGNRQDPTPAPTPAPVPATPETTPDAIRQAAIEAERTRISGISDLCRNFNVDPAQYISNGSTLDQVRAAVLDTLVRNRQPIQTGVGSVEITGSGEDEFRRDASDAIAMRSNPGAVQNPTRGAQSMRNMSLRDLGIECLARAGGNVNSLLRYSSDEIFAEVCRQFYNPANAFPSIMDETIRKSIVHLYNQVPTTFQAFTTTGTLKDFKNNPDHEYLIGGVGGFELVPENGELKNSKPATGLMPQRKLDTYGKQFTMTRQAFIDDDIGFITEVPGLYATAAKRTIDRQVYGILFGNPVIFDGKKLFCKEHGNLLKTSGAPSLETIQAALLLIQRQTDPWGDPIYITPRNIVTGIGYEFELKKVFHSTLVPGSNNNDINPLNEYPLSTIQSPVLNGLAGEGAVPWFLTADAMSVRGIQVDYLNGQQTPTIRRMETPGVLGFAWDIYLDWGIAVRDFRGLVRNDGTTIESPLAA